MHRLLPFLVWAGLEADVPLLVCLPSGQVPFKIESVLNPAIAPMKAMVFTRIVDLEAMLPVYPQSPIITSAAYARYHQDYVVLLKGGKGGQKLKKYVLIAAKPGIDNTDLSVLTVGVLDFLGREKMPAFVQEAFNLKFTQLKRVIKQGDLLSLLGLESVDAAIIEEADFPDFQASTKLPLTVLLVSKPMDSFPVLMAPGRNPYPKLQAALKGKGGKVQQALNIGGWE